MDISFYPTRKKKSQSAPPSLHSLKKLNFIIYMLGTILKYLTFSLHLLSANEQHAAFLIKTEHTPRLSGSLGNKNSNIQKKSVIHTVYFRIKAIQLEEVNLFKPTPLFLGENTVLLKHFPVHIFENKKLLADVPVKWVPLEWLTLESLVVVDSPAVQILYLVLCV